MWIVVTLFMLCQNAHQHDSSINYCSYFYIHVFSTDICTRDLRGPAVIQKLSELNETEQNHV